MIEIIHSIGTIIREELVSREGLSFDMIEIIRSGELVIREE